MPSESTLHRSVSVTSCSDGIDCLFFVAGTFAFKIFKFRPSNSDQTIVELNHTVLTG